MVPLPPLPSAGAPPEPATRRALQRQYKDTPPQAGIYRVHNTLTQHGVLKASLNLPGALNRERFELRMGSHRDRALQAAWRQHGEAGVLIEVVDVIKPRPEPGFNLAAALAEALQLWQAEQAPAPVAP